jgi:hypothetical protein
LCYTDDSRPWFDLGVLSRYGKQQADQLKYENRRTYQELIFEGLAGGPKANATVYPSDENWSEGRYRSCTTGRADLAHEKLGIL